MGAIMISPYPFIDKVTVTGADDSTHVKKIPIISSAYPFVEWGILLSQSYHSGAPRFPSVDWLHQLKEEHDVGGRNINLCGHLCGRWVRDLCEGKLTFVEDLPELYTMFSRIQLNFHAYQHKIKQDAFITALKDERLKGVQFIFQMDDVNNGLLDVAKENGIDAIPLFDSSGGAGILPKEWPCYNGYAGFAGGLSPLNVSSQLEKIYGVRGKGVFMTCWIDAETHLRTKDNQELDFARVILFLLMARNWAYESVKYPPDMKIEESFDLTSLDD